MKTASTTLPRPPVAERATGVGARFFLGCGIAAIAWYVLMHVVVPLADPAYSAAFQTVSELSAVGAPTRNLWIVMGIPYDVLVVALGWGIWLAAGDRKLLRWMAAIVILQAAINPLWPPMHLRETIAAGGATLTDSLHIAFTALWGVLSLLLMGLAAAALDTRFRVFTALMAILMLAFSAWTTVYVPEMEANLPTPWIGVVERLGMAAFFVWLLAFTIALMREPRPHQEQL